MSWLNTLKNKYKVLMVVALIGLLGTLTLCSVNIVQSILDTYVRPYQEEKAKSTSAAQISAAQMESNVAKTPIPTTDSITSIKSEDEDQIVNNPEDENASESKIDDSEPLSYIAQNSLIEDTICNQEIIAVINAANSSMKDYLMGNISSESLDEVWYSNSSINRVKYNTENLLSSTTNNYSVMNLLNVSYEIKNCLIPIIYSDSHIQIKTEEHWEFKASIFCKKGKEEHKSTRVDLYPNEEYHLIKIDGKWVINEWLLHETEIISPWECNY